MAINHAVLLGSLVQENDRAKEVVLLGLDYREEVLKVLVNVCRVPGIVALVFGNA